MSKLLVTLGFVFALAAWADPLAEADAFLSGTNFTDSFRCGDEANYNWQVKRCQFGCGADGCGSACERQNLMVNRLVAACESDAVKIYSDDGAVYDVTRAGFEADAGNPAKAFLRELNGLLQLNGTHVLSRTTPAEYKAKVNGVETTLPALHVEGEYRLEDGSGSFDFLVTLVKSAPGVARLARFRMNDMTWFRLVDVKAVAR